MRYFIIVGFFLLSMNSARAQQKRIEPTTAEIINDLDLSPAQKHAMTDSIIAYRKAEKMRQIELRRKLVGLLTIPQQIRLRHLMRRWR